MMKNFQLCSICLTSLWPVGPAKGKQPRPHFWARRLSQEDVKRRRLSLDKCEDFNLSHHLIKVLERNNRVLNAQLETQSMNSQLDREQQKAHTDILSSALSKICDAFSRIADKLWQRKIIHVVLCSTSFYPSIRPMDKFESLRLIITLIAIIFLYFPNIWKVALAF